MADDQPFSSAYPGFRAWRDFYRRMHVESVADREQAAAFAERAAEVRDEVDLLLRNGLNDGAKEALGTRAEEDMVDFCIMVDLSEGVEIPEVDPLDEETRLHLNEFLSDDPWHSLAVDTDMTVALAMLEQVAEDTEGRPWHQVCPNLVWVMSDLLARAGGEQVDRFAGEIQALSSRTGVTLPQDVLDITRYVIENNAQRLGIRTPEI